MYSPRHCVRYKLHIYIWRILQGEASAHAQSSLQMALTERRNQDMLFRALPHEIGVHTTRTPPRGIHLSVYMAYLTGKSVRVYLYIYDIGIYIYHI